MKTVVKVFLLLLIAVGLNSFAYAASLPTNVQFNPSNTGDPYPITGITTFDWDDLTGTAAIEQGITVTKVDGSSYTTFLSAYFAGTDKTPGDEITMRVHAQSRLTEFRGSNLVGDTSGLNVTGSGSGYEVTMALSMTEKAIYGSPATGVDSLWFSGVSEGTFAFYLDNTPDSDSVAGTGYLNSDPNIGAFLSGTTKSVSGNYTTDNNPDPITSNGNIVLQNTITSYDKNIIDTDPSNPDVILDGAAFNTSLALGSIPPASGYDLLGVNGVIGMDQVTYNGQNMLILLADATTPFTAIPEPATIALFGFGLLSVAGISRSRRSNG